MFSLDECRGTRSQSNIQSKLEILSSGIKINSKHSFSYSKLKKEVEKTKIHHTDLQILERKAKKMSIRFSDKWQKLIISLTYSWGRAQEQ
jgi:hypothetical protein